MGITDDAVSITNHNHAPDSSVTLKYGKGYDDSWFVAKGSPAEIKDQIIQYFGLTGDDLADKTPHEIVLQGQQIAQGTAAVADKLGGSVHVDWPSKDDKPAAKPKWSGKKSVPAKDEKAEHPFGEVLARIEGATSEDDLKAIYATQKEAFEHPDVKDASKSKFATLKENA